MDRGFKRFRGRELHPFSKTKVLLQSALEFGECAVSCGKLALLNKGSRGHAEWEPVGILNR